MTVLIVFLGLAVMGFSIPRPTRADAPSPAATLAVGDSWTYDFKLIVSPITFTGSLTQNIIHRQDVNVQGTTYDSFKLTDSGSGSILAQTSGVVITGSWTASGDDYWRVSDQGDIK